MCLCSYFLLVIRMTNVLGILSVFVFALFFDFKVFFVYACYVGLMIFVVIVAF